jgi:hypothetical protein
VSFQGAFTLPGISRMLNVGIFIQTLDVAFKRPHRTQWLMTNRAHPRTARLGNCYR